MLRRVGIELTYYSGLHISTDVPMCQSNPTRFKTCTENKYKQKQSISSLLIRYIQLHIELMQSKILCKDLIEMYVEYIMARSNINDLDVG